MKTLQQVSLPLAVALLLVIPIRGNAQSDPFFPDTTNTAPADGTFVANTLPPGANVKECPEPSTAWATLGLGLLGVSVFAWKKHRQSGLTKVSEMTKN